MKKLFYITSVIVLACVLASGFIIPVTSETNSAPARINAEIPRTEYIIKAKGDRIVVYKENMTSPFIETTRAVSSLPSDIQKKLNRGISYQSEEDMQKALNEFCS
ncbi:MAG: hypothetical protein IKK10_04240 [Clostridia bacterium]|nr:hypothetical protein [Clostridia bacterium]